MSDPWKLQIPAHVVVRAVAPGLQIPPEGWHAAAFAQHGAKLLKGMVRLSRIVTKKARPVIASIARQAFERQLHEIIALALRRAGHRSVKDENPTQITISVPQHEHLWRQAIEDVLREQGMEVVTEMVPPIQSVMAQSYHRVSILMGQEPSLAANQRIAREAQEVARRVTQISETTRKLLEREIRGAIDEGLSVSETAIRLADTMPGLERNRINTIARTETSNAWNKGSVAALKESETITHVSVIGCESREVERWGQPSYQQFMWRGESTCGIEMVPVEEAEQLVFHPNHTGVTVPAAFRNADGTVESIGGGVGEE